MDIRIISAAFVLGIFSAEALGAVNICMFTCSVILVLLVKLLLTRKIQLLLLLTAVFFAFGATAYKAAYRDELTDIGKFFGCETVIEGYICDIPHKQYGMMKYTLNATEINNEKVNEKILVSADEEYEFGDSVLLVGTLKPIKEQMNENGYNMKHYYKGKGITARITAKASQPCLLERTGFSVSYAANFLRCKIQQITDMYGRGETCAVLKLILTGDHYFLSGKTNSLLTRTATRSLFYPAYIHIMLINICVEAFAFSVKKKKRDIFLAVFFVLYTLANTTHPTFVRGCLFAAAAIGSERIFKRVYYPDIYAAAILVTCAINPMMAFNAGYVMSAASAAAVKAFYEPLTRRFKIYGRPAGVLMLSVITSIAVLPLSAYYFNGISPYSAAASIFILPAAAAVMLASPIFLGLLYFTGKAYAAGSFMTGITSFMLAVPKITELLPFSRIIIKSPSIVFIAAYGTAVVAAAYLIRGKTAYAERLAAVFAALFGICAVSFAVKVGTVEVDFVNVGQGDAAVIRSAMGASIIVDGGGSEEYSDYNTGEMVFVPYLVSKGETTIDAAFLSHYHKDHAQGIIAAVENLRVKTLYLPASLPDSEIRAELERAAGKNGTRLYYVDRNMRITFNDGLTAEITVPDSATRMSGDENDTSLLINISYGEFNCLFTGDMSGFAEKNLIRKNRVPAAEVLKISHHGSDTSTCDEFYERVSPEYSVICVGEDNTYGLPGEEVLGRISNSCILRTDTDGDIRIISDKKGNIKIHTFK